MRSVKQLKEAIFRLQEEVDDNAKLEMDALKHLSEVLEMHEDEVVRKIAHAVVDIFEALYKIEEKERGLLTELEKKEHKKETADKEAVMDVEGSIAELRLLLSDTRKDIDINLLSDLAEKFRQKAIKQHEEVHPEEF